MGHLLVLVVAMWKGSCGAVGCDSEEPAKLGPRGRRIGVREVNDEEPFGLITEEFDYVCIVTFIRGREGLFVDVADPEELRVLAALVGLDAGEPVEDARPPLFRGTNREHESGSGERLGEGWIERRRCIAPW